jgi:hypothetical protein
MIYLSAPYYHQDPAIREERFRIALSVVTELMRKGYDVFAPIVYWHTVLQHDPRIERFYFSDMLKNCDEFWVLKLSGWKDSHGVNGELVQASLTRKKTRFVSPNLEDLH